MRKDLAQLLVETPRRGAGECYRVHRRKASQDIESAPTKQGMRRPYFARKEFGEYFAPLRGMIRKNVGRPWSKIYSELTTALTGGGVVIEHVKLHLRDFVISEPYWIDGKPHHHPRWGGDRYIPISKGQHYVDANGILREGTVLRRSKSARDTTPRYLPDSPNSVYKKMDGVWYRVWLKKLPGGGLYLTLPKDGSQVFCLWLKLTATFGTYNGYRSWVLGSAGRASYRFFAEYGRDDHYAVRKEPLSSRVIRRELLDERLSGGKAKAA